MPGVEASEAVVEAVAAVAPAPGLAASARGVPVEDEQDGGGESTTSRTGGARVGDELGRAGEEQRRSRTGGIWPRAGLAARESLLILPRLGLMAARGPGCMGIPPALRFGAPKLAALELALISRAYAPPSAAMRDYAPSRGDGLRPATRRA